MKDQSQSEYTYYAFISYKREDEKWAKWLQKKLESYGFPVALRKENPKLPSKIRPIFRDQSELSGGNLNEEIEKGLADSKYLIVICSPRSAQSPWVSKEVQYFIDNGREKNIIPFIIGGTPNAKDPEEECFPEGLRQLSGEKEILGININEMGRDAAAIKVIARMFGLRFDTLWQRHERDKRRKLIGWGIVAAVIIASITGVAIFINTKNLDLERAYSELESKNTELESKNLKLMLANDTITAERDRANEQTGIAERERNNAIKANKDLSESNRQLAEERNNVLKANWKMMEKHGRSVAAKAISEIEKGNVEESIMALLSVAPSANEKPYVPEVEYALRLAYEKYSSDGWIYTEMDGFYDFIYSTSDDKYLICENNNCIDIISTKDNKRWAQIERLNYDESNSYDDLGNYECKWGSFPSKNGSNLVIIDGSNIGLYDIEDKKYTSSSIDFIRSLAQDFHLSDNGRFNYIFADNGELRLVSPKFKYSLLEIDHIDSNAEEWTSYELRDSKGHSILSLDRNYKQDRFDLYNYNLMSDVSFSPDEDMIIFSFYDGHNELRHINDINNPMIWWCGNDDCVHYSNRNRFVNNNKIIHTSAFEDHIKIFDVHSLKVTDSIYTIYPIEGADFYMDRKETRLWITEYNTPIFYQKLTKKNIDKRGFKEIDFKLSKKITLPDEIISIKNNKIECVNTYGTILWIHESQFGCSLLGTFDNDRLIIIMDDMPRGGDEIAFIDKNSGKEVYRIPWTSKFFTNEDNSKIIASEDAWPEGYEILDYKSLITACKNIICNKTLSQKGIKLFSL